MSISFASLNSGSNGNSYFVGTEGNKILIDAGISAKEIGVRLNRLNIDPTSIEAIFISHEHSDHIKGLEVFVKKYKTKVFISEPTYFGSRLKIDKGLLYFIQDGEQINIGNLKIDCFRKIHDAVDPFSFTVSSYDLKIGVFTDLGAVCSKLIKHFSSCNAAFLEANYDVELLKNSNYPYYLKSRISDGKGHLSNILALELFNNHKHEQLSHLILSHLSENNNCPDLVCSLFEQFSGHTLINVASRFKESELFSINSELSLSHKSRNRHVQTSLF